MSADGDLRRTPQARLLEAAFIQAHIVEYVIQCNKLPRAPRVRAQSVDPSQDVGIEVQVRAHGVEDLRSLLDQAR